MLHETKKNRCKATLSNGNNCRHSALENEQYCYVHSKNKIKKTVIYDNSKDSMMLYVSSKKRNPKVDVDGWMKKYIEAKNIYGVSFIEDCESEIILLRSLIASAVSDYFIIPIEEIGKRQWLRREIKDMTESLSRIIKSNADIKYGKQYSVKIEEVQKVIFAIQSIIIKSVSDPEDLKKISKALRKTLAIPMQTKEAIAK